MTTRRTRNLRLYLSSGLTTEAKANLEILDRLGDIHFVDNTGAVMIRSKGDVHLLAADKNTGGAGKASVYVGSANNPVDKFQITADETSLHGILSLRDVSPNSSSILRIQHKADNSTQKNTLTLNVTQPETKLTLGTNVTILGKQLFKLSAKDNQEVNLIVPNRGTLVTKDGSETFTEKTIDAKFNTIKNITNDNINADAKISYNKLSLSNSLTNKDIAIGAQIAAAKIAVFDGPLFKDTNLHLALHIIQDAIEKKLNREELKKHSETAAEVHGVSGELVGTTSEQTLSNKTLHSPKFSGKIQGIDKVSIGLDAVDNTSDEHKWRVAAELRNKKIDGTTNHLSNISYQSLDLKGKLTEQDFHEDAKLPYAQLDLTRAIKNSDISLDSADRISGKKVVPDFGEQLISTEAGVKIKDTAGAHVSLLPPHSGFVSSYTLTLPQRKPSTENEILAYDGEGGLKWTTPVGTGTVTKVGLHVPATLFELAGGPIRTTGSFDLQLKKQEAGVVFCGPRSGLDAEPCFRKLTKADLPSHTHGTEDLVDFSNKLRAQLVDTLQNSNQILWKQTEQGKLAANIINFGSLNTSTLPEGNNLYFTPGRVFDVLRGILQVEGLLSLAYDTNIRKATLSLNQGALQDLADLLGDGHAEDWTEGNSIKVHHNLNTKDVFVEVYELDSGRTLTNLDIRRYDENTLHIAKPDEITGQGCRILVRRIR